MYKRQDGQDTIRWYVYDGLGSVVGEVDPNGVMTARHGFDVYGATRSSSGTATSKHGFVGGLGHPSEEETGLVSMRARYYDAGVGRFVSQDPAKSGINWFAYANNSPTVYCDRSGKDADLVETECSAGMETDLMGQIAGNLGEFVGEDAEAFEIVGQELNESAAFTARSLEAAHGLGQGTFRYWAIQLYQGAQEAGQLGGTFAKAWLRYGEEEALAYLEGDEGEIFASHATRCVGTLAGL